MPTSAIQPPIPFRNPVTNRGPLEGRPPTEYFAHQRWDEFFPKVGYVMNWGPCVPGTKLHPNLANQNPNSVWTYGTGPLGGNSLAPPLIKGRYGEPILTRIYNTTPVDRAQNGGFGRNESQLHFHNAHNGAESDGATGAHHFPGTFYDYRWSTTLARRDKINTGATERKASAPDGNGGLTNVPGDFREIQGTMWAHDHRFFFTAENVYKGNLMKVNYYSGPERGNEQLNDGVNLRLPSGKFLDYGNIDFDVNLVISDAATDQARPALLRHLHHGRLLGRHPARQLRLCAVHGGAAEEISLPRPGRQHVPLLEVRHRQPDGHSRTDQVHRQRRQLGGQSGPADRARRTGRGRALRFRRRLLDQYRVGDKLKFVNMERMRDDGRGGNGALSLAQALAGDASDPVLGALMEFRVVSSLPSVDAPGQTLTTANSCGVNDKSQVPLQLTQQIPVVAPVRTRTIEWGRAGDGNSRDPVTGQCTPDCPEDAVFPWTVKINGQSAHSFNANRISELIPKPGEIEHWTYVNGGGGWDHPIHLHFEEGITMNRGGQAIPATELNVRKDVWHLRPSGQVQFQIQFGEYGGSYVNHCHNTVHEDFALLMRIQLLAAAGPQVAVTPTPNPTPDGVFFTTPEILPEGDPRSGSTASSGGGGSGSGGSGGGGNSGPG